MAAVSVEALVDRGMQAQLHRLREAVDGGVPRVGWKLGITDAAAQRRLGLSGPAVGALAGDRSYVSGQRVPVPEGAVVRGEAEIAIRLARDVPAECSLAQAHAAISMLGPAIELIDISKPGGDLETILGHSIFHAAVVFGEELDPATIDRMEAFWPRVFRNGKAVRQPEPSLVPQDLNAIVLAVAQCLARYDEPLKAGDRIISGSFVKPMIAEPGDTVRVDFGALGRVELSIAA